MKKNILECLKNIFHKIMNFMKKVLKKIEMSNYNLYYIIKSIIISCIVSIIILLIIFFILPKTSWLNISIKPYKFEIYDFYGNGIINSSSIELDKGILINKNAVTMMIDDKRYDLEENELQFVVNNINLDIEKKIDDDLNNYLIFSKNVKIDFGYVDINPIKKANIKIEENHFFLTGDDTYSISINSDNDIRKSITIDNDTQLHIRRDLVDVYIKGNKIEIPKSSSIRFFSREENHLAVIFSFSNNSVCCFSLRKDDSCYLKGNCVSFNGSSLPISTLKQTYLNKQNEYDISLLEIDAVGNDRFQLEYEFLDEENNLQISGKTKEINMSDNSLNYSIYTFLLENQGAIITGIFAAFITAYIPMILEHKKE